jgi:hypothetical protein
MLYEGYLLISDISGYTAFLTQAELEHAHAILEDLFNALLENIKLPMKIAKLEGDAIFAYARQGSFIEGVTLLEGIERLYCIFAETRQTMHVNNTCTCNACQLIPTLDLKFFAHYGQFIIDKKEELSGPDVILIHRLMKNSVIEDTGIAAYVLFTQAAIDKMQIAAAASEMAAHPETYDHLGDIQCYVHDLAPVYAAYRERERVITPRAGAWHYFDCIVPVPPAVAWDYLTEPTRKRKVIGANEVLVIGKLARRGVGTVHHCVHGKQTSPQRIVDWRPFDYFTHETTAPMGLYMHMTTKFTPVEDGTQIEWICSIVKGNRILAAAMMKVMQSMMSEGLAEMGDNMGRAIEEDIASGRLVLSDYDHEQHPVNITARAAAATT